MTPEETMLREQLEDSKAENIRLSGRVKQLESALANWEQGDTMPPSKQDEETGDNSLAKMVAQLSMRIDNVEARESERAGEIQTLMDRAEKMLERSEQVLKLAERVTVIDPKDIITIRDAVLSLPCSGCGKDMRERLSMIPGGKAE